MVGNQHCLEVSVLEMERDWTRIKEIWDNLYLSVLVSSILHVADTTDKSELMPNYGENIKLINIIIDNKCCEKIREDNEIKIDWRSLCKVIFELTQNDEKELTFGLKIKLLGIENVGISDRLFLTPILGILRNVEFSWDMI